MRKEQYSTSVANGSNYKNFVNKKQSITESFVQWFRNFLETAE
ncbi:hypothetical protein [Polaribacter sp.]